MKNRMLAKFAAAALFLTLAFPAMAPAAPKTPAKPATATTPAPERHPEIHAAIESLEHAKQHLNEAKHDFQGHRVEAIRAIDAALEQLRICEKYD